MLNADSPSVNSRIQSIDRAVELLEAIAGAPEPETAPALADACGLNRSTAWRILATLEHHGLVERDPDSNRYSLGVAVLKLAAAAGHEPLVRLAHPVLRRLADATGETVNVAVARRLELVYADQVQARHVMAPNWLGHTVPLHATSTGKAFLAALPPDELEAIVRAGFERFTDTTITDPAALRAELERVRARGFAVSHGELEQALWGVSAAARDAAGRPAAVVSVWGADARVRDRLDELGERATTAARELEALLR
ncbi:MAG TPA: IclR family transcriptional regulator [Solirubrobacteraceae bacterium]|nr:IclR family transcriptional regulator [Solirubrobacteraceae bacterium]